MQVNYYRTERTYTALLSKPMLTLESRPRQQEEDFLAEGRVIHGQPRLTNSTMVHLTNEIHFHQLPASSSQA